MTVDDGIHGFYNRKWREAEMLRAAIKAAEHSGAPEEEILALRRRLDLAEYVGD